jgi:hypothetical protein
MCLVSFENRDLPCCFHSLGSVLELENLALRRDYIGGKVILREERTTSERRSVSNPFWTKLLLWPCRPSCRLCWSCWLTPAAAILSTERLGLANLQTRLWCASTTAHAPA